VDPAGDGDDCARQEIGVAANKIASTTANAAPELRLRNKLSIVLNLL